MYPIKIPSAATISAVLHRYHRLRQARPPAVIPAAAFPPPPAQLPPCCSTLARRLRQARLPAVIPTAALLLPPSQLPPCCCTVARRLPPLPKNKLALPPPLPPQNYIALLAPCGQKSMSTGTNTSSAVQAGAPTTLRRSRSMTSASNGSGQMVGHGSPSPAFFSDLLVPLFMLGLPRRRLAGLATHILFRMLAFILRLRIVVSLPFLQQSRPAGLDSPRLRNPSWETSPLWPAAEHPSNPCSPLKMRMTSPSLRSPCARDIWIDP